MSWNFLFGKPREPCFFKRGFIYYFTNYVVIETFCRFVSLILALSLQFHQTVKQIRINRRNLLINMISKPDFFNYNSLIKKNKIFIFIISLFNLRSIIKFDELLHEVLQLRKNGAIGFVRVLSASGLSTSHDVFGCPSVRSTSVLIVLL